MTSTDELFLAVTVDAGPEVSEEKLFKLTGQLQKQLRRAGADSVDRPATAQAPEGAKALPIVIGDIGTLVMTVGSTGVLTAIIQLLQHWALRKEERKVKVVARHDDKSFEFEYAPDITSQEELLAFAEKLTRLMNQQNIELP